MTADKAERRGLVGPSIAAACVFALLIGLGTWQVKRLAWKEALIATVTARLAAPPAQLPPPADWARLDPARDEYRRVTVSATFENDKEALVYTTGSTLRGGDTGPGYWVFTPARFAGGTVMVNRGFVPEGRQNPATRPQGEIAGPVDIVGIMRWPERPGLFTPAGEPATNLWFSRDSTAIAAAKRIGPVAPFYIDQESPAAPGGLPQAGAMKPSFPNNHLGYAFTWYGLAAVLAVSFGIWLVGRLRARQGAPV
ncbi:MAG TPA: SURF1 family protein [Xanthobacteraceae bacterium]|nr:SURF1 family protein [Xanthobacteraceae bacterium]